MPKGSPMNLPPVPEIHQAVEDGDIERVAAILDADTVQISLRTTWIGEPLHVAASQNDALMANLLIARGADLNARGLHGMTPLHFAAQEWSIDVAELLVDRGADLNIVDEGGYTPLRTALCQLAPECDRIARLLLERGCELDFSSAVYLGDIARVQHLLAMTPELIAKSPMKNMLLCDAVDGVRTKIFHHAHDPDLCGKKARWIADCATMIEMLIEFGADPNCFNPAGRRPLHSAVDNPDLGTELAKTLIRLGADVSARSRVGETPLSFARRARHRAACALLREHGALE